MPPKIPTLMLLLLAATQAFAATEPTITTVAGGGSPVDIGDGGPATSARLVHPVAVAVDDVGNLYIAEGTHTQAPCRVRVVTPGGIISTLAGNGTTDTPGDNVPATSVSVCPTSLAIDASGNVYVGEHGRIRKVKPNGYISTVARDAAWGDISDIAIDAYGNIYITDTDSRYIRRIDTNGSIRTVAGNGQAQTSGDGGPALSAGMSPDALAIDPMGRLVFVDDSSRSVRRITTTGTVVRIAGNGSFRSDPMAINVDAYYPTGLAFDRAGALYVSNDSNLLHVITPEGVIEVVAGVYNDSIFSPYGAWWGFGGDGGPATQAILHEPQDVAVDGDGNVYIADTRNDRVRKVTPIQLPKVPAGANAFLPAVQYTVGTYTAGLDVGDFNRDRRTDVVVTTASWTGTHADPATDYRLHVFHQQPDGTLAPPERMAFPESRYVGRVRAVDLNLDGYSDVALATELGIGTYLGSATGLRPGELMRGEPTAAVPGDYIAGDVDLDGWPDLVAWIGGRSEGGSWPDDQRGLIVFYGNGAGGSDRHQFMALDIGGGRLAWGDVNRDGRSDVLMASRRPGYGAFGVALFLHDGVSGFHMPSFVDIPEAGVWGPGIATGDFDADGLIDVILSKAQNAPDAALARLRQTEGGQLEFVGSWPTYDSPTQLLGIDVGGDGRDDLLTLHGGWNAVGYEAQMPAPATSWLDQAVKYEIRSSGNPRLHSLAAGDLDGDGCLDVAVSDYNYGLQVLHGRACMKKLNGGAPRLPGLVNPAGTTGPSFVGPVPTTAAGGGDHVATSLPGDGRGGAGAHPEGAHGVDGTSRAPRIVFWSILLVLAGLFPAGLTWLRWR